MSKKMRNKKVGNSLITELSSNVTYMVSCWPYSDYNYDKELIVDLDDDTYLTLPIYARVTDGEFRECFTGTRIPIAKDANIPDFCAYRFKLVNSLQDYRKFLANVELIKQYKAEYMKAFRIYMARLERLRSLYDEKHSVLGQTEEMNNQQQSESSMSDSGKTM